MLRGQLGVLQFCRFFIASEIELAFAYFDVARTRNLRKNISGMMHPVKFRLRVNQPEIVTAISLQFGQKQSEGDGT